MAIRIGSLIIKLAVDHGLLAEGLARSERDIAKTTRQIQRRGREIADFGKNLSMAVSLPLAGLAVASVKAAKESADALGQVNAALASMGDQAGRTTEQLQALAASQMRQSLYDDDQILREVTANLLTFGKVSGEQFDRAQQAALDLATRMNGDLQGATIQIGKALNDPVKGLTALSKAGIQFTADQKAMITSMVEAGNVAGAQQVILGELERQFGGAAKAAREADPGAALAQSFANFQEQVGEKLLPLLPAIFDGISGVLDAFSALPGPVQTGVVALGGLAAAIGPLAMGFGGLMSAASGTLGTLGAMGVSFGAVASAALPVIGIAAAVAAAAYAIYANWDKISPMLDELAANFKAAIGDDLRQMVNTATAALTELWKGPLGEALRVVGKALLDFQVIYYSVLGSALIKILDVLVAAVSVNFDAISTGLTIISRLLQGDFRGAWEAAKEFVIRTATTIAGVIDNLFPGLVQTGKDIIRGIVAGIKAAPGAVRDALLRVVQSGYDSVKDFLGIRSPSRLFMEIGANMMAGLAVGVEMFKLDGLLVAQVKKAATAVEAEMQGLAQRVRDILGELFPEIEAANAKAAKIADLFAGNRAGIISDGTRREAVRRAQGFDQGPLAEAQKVREATVEIGDAIEKQADRAEVQTVRVAQTFEQMAKDVMGSLRGLVDGIRKGDFFSIFEGILGIVTKLGSAGVFGSRFQSAMNRIPQNANGTAFHPGGLMMVGERGPEILAAPRGSRVVPNHELRQAGANRLKVTVAMDENTGSLRAFVRNAAGELVADAAPAIASAGATQAIGRIRQMQSRSLA